MLAPSGMGVFPDDSGPSKTTTEKKNSTTTGGTPGKTALTLSQFGRRIILMKTRARVTKDAGASILVLESKSESEDSEESD